MQTEQKEEKKREQIQHAHAYIKTKEKCKEEDELVTTCINVNAQDVNSYTHIKKGKKVKTYMYKKLYQ